MYFLSVISALIALGQACPMHGLPDHVAAENNINVANLRKRGWVRPAPQKIAITNVHIFDGFEYDNQTSTVLIDGSFIGSDAANATIIDGKGATLMPGLIDNHNHPTTIADLKNLSSYGVTTTMCMSCWVATDHCESLRNQPGLTDFYSAGFSAVVPNSSHSKLAEMNPAVNAPEYFIYNSSMCPGWVKDRFNTGSDYIKLVAEAYPPSMTKDEHNIIVKTAHQYGYWTMTHASTLDTYNMAIESGTDIIQHTPADEPLSDASIAKILAGGHYVTPTINIYQYTQAATVSLGLTTEQTANLNQTVPSNVKRIYDAGIPILAGTDGSINSNGPADIYFGSSLHQELEMLNSYGVSNVDVLKAATSRAAVAYNMLDRGVIAPGMRADLLLVRGNPLVNISKTREIEKVWIAGIEYEG
ncbi:hypothetical protein LTR10_017903 [Elasticomyces elasticus]|uniref:Amidohydrolase-related domain-containing protein n=1 Tax=Exophiala sideris TaxID=1016849 RepID=A0ABR0IWV8_9EURO|nr:hypothetical protein LTR10_017903 [Elasticomyces elasticus]KAK5021806.1 hypothetical protein LTS07_010701 [Exophiala sideris]KAK5025836.1 hypothetical protein LTR13_010299 [Exophiala sideris]KAK5050200.1 hypothetical protein LTR69_010687 [Exophiala sideris]KAK5177043.1 hypothetical protein LTR44_010480 [Eurotiomycetes sp. CCFEE 6388]